MCAVLLETSKGNLVVDLYYEKCPKACQNFISLCQIKYYNNCVFFNIQKNFIVQTGDPTNTGTGGHCIYHLLNQISSQPSKSEILFEDEIHKDLRHNKKGLLCMANRKKRNSNASQFYFTTADRPLDYLDDSHTIFGEVSEGLEEVLMSQINNAFTEDDGRPYQVIRIMHTHVLFDPWEQTPLDNLSRLIPSQSPEPTPFSEYEKLGYVLEENESTKVNEQTESKTEEELEEELKMKEARSRAVVLEMIGDLPDADMKPPENVLFVCKLNPVTTSESLAIIFGRFGQIISCEVIRDHKTGDSLQYAFVEFESKYPCEQAYMKMQNVVIDDRRIHVDFSQSVSKLWNRHYNRGHKKKIGAAGTREFVGGEDNKEAATRRPPADDRRNRPDQSSRRYEGYKASHSTDSRSYNRYDDRGRTRGEDNRDRRRPRSPATSSEYPERKRSRYDQNTDHYHGNNNSRDRSSQYSSKRDDYRNDDRRRR